MRTEMAIGHCDADSFYVAAERVRNRFLVGKPVGVLGNQGACVIAKSYELKSYGVKTGEPIWEAVPKCPQAVFVKRDFRWYETLSRRMLACINDFSPTVEYYSIDEFFFLAVPPPGVTLQQTAEAIRSRISEAVGVPVTVGISRSRTLAKLISDSAKPFGALAALDDAAVEALLAGLPVTEISGIAGRRAARLLPWGIRTCLDLAKADRRLVRELLTATGEALWWELKGDPVQAINTRRIPHKNLSRGGSFGGATADPIILYAWLVRNLERLIEELEWHAVLPGRLTVALVYKDGRDRAGQTDLKLPSDRFDLLLDALRPCLRRAWIPRARATHMHLTAGRLTPRSQAPLGLFDCPQAAARAEAVAKLKREVNARHGRFALRSGVTASISPIYEDDANDYDICDVRGKAASNLMCTGIALAWSVLPTDMTGRPDVSRRLHDRGGELEAQFWYRDRSPKLPVLRGGKLQTARWGNGLGRSRSLPQTGWVWPEELEQGLLRELGPERVEIPATLGHENGTWYAIRQGIRGLLVPDERGAAVVYMLVEPASDYYRVMTRSTRMPVLIGGRM